MNYIMRTVYICRNDVTNGSVLVYLTEQLALYSNIVMQGFTPA